MVLSRWVWILRYTNNHKVGNAEIDPIVVTRERGSGLGALLSAQRRCFISAPV